MPNFRSRAAFAAILATAALAGCAQAHAEAVRFATYNLSLNRNNVGQLAADLSNVAVDDSAFLVANPLNRTTLPQRRQQAATVAEIIKTVRPNVLLLNEFDYAGAQAGSTLDAFADNFLNVRRSDIANLGGAVPAPAANAAPIAYQNRYIAPSNTGIASGKDLDNALGVVTTPLTNGYGNDAFGFGEYEGRFGMAFLSQYPIDTAGVRTFQQFLWNDMPGNRIPVPFYSTDEVAVLRLSSKSHWDIPVVIDGVTVHILASHPTPPVFDGPEDRNGTRNADEIRFWNDYISGTGSYIYDDAGGRGGLSAGDLFVIMGDQNADPNDGDGIRSAIQQVLANPRVDQNPLCTPSAEGGFENRLQGGPTGANARHTGDPRLDTADFADFPTSSGNLRADHVIASRAPGLRCTGAGIFWPAAADPLSPLVGQFGFYPSSLGNGYASSDHKLVWVDASVVPAPASVGLLGFGALALLRRRRG